MVCCYVVVGRLVMEVEVEVDVDVDMLVDVWLDCSVSW